MTPKAGIVSKQTIKPSSPTPNHLRDFKISILDQLAPPSIYIPIVLFYSASNINAFVTDFTMISGKLKTSLSEVLTLYYPLCGRLKGISSVDCNDAGVLYVESIVPTNLSDILKNPEVSHIKEFLPFDPYNHNQGVDHEEPAVNTAVQLNRFSCGGIGLGVCISHKIADGATTASFLNAWAAIARGHGNILAPQMEAALLFPPMDIEIDTTGGMNDQKNIVTRRFIFNGANLSRLRAKFGCFNPTSVEAVTALIWKSAMEAAKASSGERTLKPSMMSHAVNICSRMVPPLPNNLLGNLSQPAVSTLVEVDGNGMVELHDLVELVRKTIRKVDADYISKLQGDGLPKVIGSLKEVMSMVFQKGIPCYGFTSWTRFGFYNADFGWGKPTWVCTMGAPMKNVVILMPTRNGEEIEAWVTLTKHDMIEFQRNPELLQFASFDS